MRRGLSNSHGRTRWFIAVFVLFFLVAAAGCANGDDNTAGGEDEAEASDEQDSSESDDGAVSGPPIELGTYLPLTGPLASTGIAMRDATDAAIEHANANGGVNGRTLELKIRDNAYSGPQSVQKARELISDEQVAAFLGPCCSNQVAATLSLISEEQIPTVLNTFPGVRDWFEPAMPNIFTTQTLNETQSGILGELAAREEGVETLAVVFANVDIIKAMAEEAASSAEEVNPSIDSQEIQVAIGTEDWSPVVSSLQDRGADAVVFLSSITDLSNFLTQADLQGLDVPIYGNNTYADKTLFELAGEAAEGTVVSSLSQLPTEDSDPMAEFGNAMQEFASVEEPTINHVSYYAGAKAFIEVLRNIDGEVTPETIREALNSSGTLETGLMPSLEFTEEDHVGTNQVRLIQARNNEFVPMSDFIEKADLADLELNR